MQHVPNADRSTLMCEAGAQGQLGFTAVAKVQPRLILPHGCGEGEGSETSRWWTREPQATTILRPLDAATVMAPLPGGGAHSSAPPMMPGAGMVRTDCVSSQDSVCRTLSTSQRMQYVLWTTMDVIPFE